MTENEEVLTNLCQPLLDAGAERLYVSVCCGHLYVGVRAAGGCKHCRGVPEHVELGSAADVGQVLNRLNLA